MPNNSLNVLESPSRSSEQLRLLIEVSEAIATHRDLTTLFRDLAKRLPAIVPFELIALFLHDPVKNVMRVHMLGGVDGDRIPPGLEVPVTASFSGLALTTQRPVIVRSKEEALRFSTAASLVQALGVESFCMLPLTTTVRPLGAMGFGTARPHAIDDSDLEFLDLVVKQVAVAVDNVLHDESDRAVQLELSHERDRLRLLLEVSESIAAHRNLNDLFEDLAHRLPPVVPFDYINLLLHDPARDVMRLHILVAPEGATIHPGLELPIEESAAGLVWRTQQPLVVEDLEEEHRFPRLISMMRRTASGRSAPSRSPPRFVVSARSGLAASRARTIRRRTCTSCSRSANQVAVAVDNVLHDEGVRSAQQALTRERDRLQLLLEVNNAVVSRLDLDQVFASVSGFLRRLIPHEHSSLLLYEPETRQYRKHVPVIAGNEVVVKDCQIDAQWAKSPAGIAITTQRAAVFNEQDLRTLAEDSQIAECIIAQGYKSVCSVPILSRDRSLGALNLGSERPDAFTTDDVELLGQVAQQIAIAVENGLAFREIAELKEKLSTEKLYLEDEIRTEHNFDEIVGQSSTLRQVLKQVETVAPDGFDGADPRRDGHRQGTGRARDPQPERAARAHVRQAELRRHPDRPARERAVRPREGRVHRRDRAANRPLRAGARRHAVPRRGRRHSAGAAAQAAARPAGAGVRAAGQHANDPRGRPAGRRHESRPRRDGRGKTVPQRSLLPAERVSRRQSRRCASGARTSPPLVRYFTQKFSRRMNKRIETIPTEAMDALSRYHWPGNIRELENFIERAVILSRGATLDVPLAELKEQHGRCARRNVSTADDARRCRA